MIGAEVRRVSSLEANPAATSARGTNFVGPDRFQPSVPVSQTIDETGRAMWPLPASQGWLLFGPYLVVTAGIYRIKALAKVEGSANEVAYFDIFDGANNSATYAAKEFKEDPEFYVRLQNTHNLECRILGRGAALSFHGIIIEEVLLDSVEASVPKLVLVAERLLSASAEPAAFYRVLDRLAELGEHDLVEKFRAQYLAQAVPDTVDVEIRVRLLHLHGSLRAMPDATTQQFFDHATLFHSVWQHTYTVLDALINTPSTRGELEQRGYRLPFIQSTLKHRDPNEPPRFWSRNADQPDTGHPSFIEIPLFERQDEIDRSYQTSMARELGFPAYCPVTGRFLRSQHGFLIQYAHKPFIFYRFEGAETFYVCTGANSDARMFLYMPRSETIVWISDAKFRVYVAEELVRSLNLNFVVNADDVARYLNGPTRPAAVIGADNYGHYFWLDMSGLQFVVENDLHRNLAGLLMPPVQFAKVEEIFPELAHLPRHDGGAEAAFSAGVVNGYLPIHFTDMALSTSFVERMRGVAKERASDAGRPPKDVKRPLIWANFRAHNKIWSDQVEGHINIFRRLAEDHKQLTVLIDGTPDCSELTKSIVEACEDVVTFYNGLHFSLYDKMNWAMNSDAYICVIGTGLIICHSMAGARGVAHGNREHMRQLEFWHQIQPGSPTPLAPPIEAITDLGALDLQQNYEMDWRVIYDLLSKHLAERVGR